MEIDFPQRLNDANLYRELKKKLYKLALREFEKIKTEYQLELKLGIHEIPIGYVGVREFVDSEHLQFGMPTERFFWINCEGQKSDYFDTKWEVYHNAKLKLPYQDCMTDKESDLIVRFDPCFGNTR